MGISLSYASLIPRLKKEGGRVCVTMFTPIELHVLECMIIKHMSKQWIPGFFLPLLEPGYEATSYAWSV